MLVKLAEQGAAGSTLNQIMGVQASGSDVLESVNPD